MKSVDSKRLKEIQEELLRSVASFCDDHNLEYFLAYGTLIGAVRHKGFIPWDDDIDLVMKREDYERFIASYNGFSEEYRVYTTENTDWFPFPYAKIAKKETILKEENDNMSGEIGINIDLFPLDFVPEDETIRKKIKFQYQMLMLKSIRINETRSFIKNMILRVSKIFLAGKSAHSIAQNITSLAKESTKNTGKLGNLVFTEKTSDYASISAFDESVELEFEGNKYKAPRGYHEWLTNFYGNYMELPPEESRVTHHHFTAFEK